jgi:hypothetical protein
MKYKNGISPPIRGNLDGDARGTPNNRGATLIHAKNRPMEVVCVKPPVIRGVIDMSTYSPMRWMGFALERYNGQELLITIDLYNKRKRCLQQAANNNK